MDIKGTNQVKLVGTALEGISMEIYIDKKIDILDFIEEIGLYFYKLDDPIFGQKYITKETKDYIYYWLMELLNTGNYEESTFKSTVLRFNMLIDFEKIGTFKYAIDKYKKRLKQLKEDKSEDYKISACSIAIDILQIVEDIKNNF